jgi:cation:H+ antiporter
VTYILFIIGFILLVKGADWLVDGATAIAKRANISDIIVGLTIVSFGTSLPELIVNLMASFQGSSGIAIGNIFGSNIANILLIVGVAATIRQLNIQRNTVLCEIPYSLAAVWLVGFLANVTLLNSETTTGLSRLDGGILLFCFSLFLIYVYHIAVSQTNELPPPSPNSDEEQALSYPKASLLIVLGALGLFLGGTWVVNGATTIATAFGFSQTFIGLTVVAIGTSLPELVTSAIAAYKNNADIAVGNAIGSNIFNVLWVLGLSALVKPLAFDVANNIDIMVIVLATTLMLLLIIGRGKSVITRFGGVVMVIAYIVYLATAVLRG